MEFTLFLIKRILWSLLVLVGLSMVIFTIARVVPGDPARMALGPTATEEQVVELRHELGLDQPLVTQYGMFIAGLAKGDLGRSLLTERAVNTDIITTFAATFELVISTIIVAFVIGLPLGVIGATFKDTWSDNLVRFIAILAAVTPGFFVALLLQILAGYVLHILPTTGRLPPDMQFAQHLTGLLVVDGALAGRWDVVGQALRHLLLPSIALAAATMGQIARITRSSMIDVSKQDYIEAARAFGIPEWLRTFKYMLRPSFVPPLTILGLEFASLIGNAFVVELVFSWPGMAALRHPHHHAKGPQRRHGRGHGLGRFLRHRQSGHRRAGRPCRSARAHPGRAAMSDLSLKPDAAEAPRLSSAYQNWYRFSRNPTAVIGAAIIIIVVLAAILAPFITPYPDHVGAVVNFRARHLPPSFEHWFGTDNVGRDIFTRVIFGYRVSLELAVVVLGIAVPFGTVMGLLAGYFGGWTETIIMRVTDIALAIPPLVMALAVSAVMNPNLIHAMLAIAVLWWTWHTRLIYSITRQIRSQEFVEAAETIGASKFHILFREILPNCVSALAVKTSLDAGFVILVGAALSFLGLGVQPPTPDLGTMVSTGSQFLPDYWWESVLPGMAILFVSLGFNLLGDGLRDLFDVEDV